MGHVPGRREGPSQSHPLPVPVVHRRGGGVVPLCDDGEIRERARRNVERYSRSAAHTGYVRGEIAGVDLALYFYRKGQTS